MTYQAEDRKLPSDKRPWSVDTIVSDNYRAAVGNQHTRSVSAGQMDSNSGGLEEDLAYIVPSFVGHDLIGILAVWRPLLPFPSGSKMCFWGRPDQELSEGPCHAYQLSYPSGQSGICDSGEVI